MKFHPSSLWFQPAQQILCINKWIFLQLGVQTLNKTPPEEEDMVGINKKQTEMVPSDQTLSLKSLISSLPGLRCVQQGTASEVTVTLALQIRETRRGWTQNLDPESRSSLTHLFVRHYPVYGHCLSVCKCIQHTCLYFFEIFGILGGKQIRKPILSKALHNLPEHSESSYGSCG